MEKKRIPQIGLVIVVFIYATLIFTLFRKGFSDMSWRRKLYSYAVQGLLNIFENQNRQYTNNTVTAYKQHSLNLVIKRIYVIDVRLFLYKLGIFVSQELMFMLFFMKNLSNA